MPAAIREERITGAAIMTAMSEMIIPIAEIVATATAMATDRKIPVIVAVDAMVLEVIPRPQ